MTDNPTKDGPTSEVPGQPNSSNVFAGRERESLINEIVSEMKKDALKQDAAVRIAKGDWRNAISKFFAHPAVLLIIGFACTGVIATLIGNHYQSREWDRQQSLQRQEWDRQQLQLVDINGRDLKYGIINEIIKAVGERNAAAKGITYPLVAGLNDLEMRTEEKEPIENWKKVSQAWRANVQILGSKLAAHIRNKGASEIFNEITDKEAKIGSKVNIVRKDLRRYNGADDIKKKGERQYLDAIFNTIDNTREDVTKLVSIIAKEADDDIRNKTDNTRK